MIFANNEKYNKQTENKTKKNILFIFSYNSEGIILQQKISILTQFVKELKDNNLYVFSPYDNLKLVLSGAVTRIQEKISARNIKHAIKNYHIDTIIPIDCDDNIAKICCKKSINAKKKVKNFFSSYFELQQENNEIETIMLEGGLHTIKKDKKLIKKMSPNKKNIKDKARTAETNIKKQSVCVNIVAIKDNFDNQIILDFFEESLVNEKQLFCTLTNLSIDKILQIRQKLNLIAKNLLVSNYLYNIKLFIYDDKVYFGGLKYGICEETMFAVQSKQIPIVSIMLKINNDIPIENILVKQHIAYAYDFIDNQKIYFAKSINDVKNILPDKRKIQINKNLITIFLNKDREIAKPNFIRFNIAGEFKLLKFANFSTLDSYLLVCLVGLNLSIDLQVFFYTLIENLAKKACKKLLLLTEQISPMLSLLTCADIAYVNTINDCVDDMPSVISNYKIKSAFLLQDYFDENNDIANFLLRNNIKLLGYRKTKNDKFTTNNNNSSTLLANNFEEFCKNINIEYKQKIAPEDYLLHYVGISDKYNNFPFIIRFDERFNGKFNVTNLFSPNHIVDFRLNKLSSDFLGEIIDNVPFYGLFDIIFLYKKGKLYLHKYSIKNGVMSFFLSDAESNLIYESITKSLIDKDINMPTLANDINTHLDFSQKIAFIATNGKIRTLSDIIESKIYSKYIKITAR